MKKKFFRSIAHYLPQTLLLISLLTSNVLFPAIVIAQEVENINKANTVTQEETVPIDTSEDILEEGISTSIYEQESIPEIQTPPFTFENGIYTVNNVIPEEEYIYPENDNVRVKFTEVTQEGNLIIKRVELTQEQKELLNTKDNYGWDITSSMENGTFKYTLTLPNIYDNTNVEVKYTEDGNNYESIEGVSNINNNNIVIEGLDHFTLFVIVDDGDSGYTDNDWNLFSTGGYQGDTRWVTKEQTGKTATWTYTGDTISNGAIYLSWTIWTTQATNATYNVLGSNTVTVNQKLYADRTTSGANGTWSGWYRVPGTYNILNNSTVTLSVVSDATNGNLSADAVAFVDLDEKPSEVWVDDDYTSQNNTGEYFWGYNAFNTIQNGINAVASGGTVYVASGTYTENVTINKSITLYSTERPIINGGIELSNNNITVNGFKIQDGGILSGSQKAGIYINGGTSGHNILNNEIYGKGFSVEGWPGIIFGYNTSNINIKGNTITKWYQGIYINPSSNLTIENNIISTNYVGIGSDGLNNVQIIGNTFSGNTSEAIGSSNVGTNVKINNNNFTGNIAGVNWYGDTTNKIDATMNWWGHHTGPSVTSNPSDLGDKISGNILYKEWLCQPYTSSNQWVSQDGVCQLNAPTNLGWNVSSLTTNPGETPVKLSCGSYTNDNTPSQVWTAVAGNNIKYQRQAKAPNGGWWTDTIIYTNTYTPFLYFGQSGQGNGWEGEWNSRVRAFYDENNNEAYDTGEVASSWSGECKITYDKTAPSTPTGLYFWDVDNNKKVECGGFSNTKHIKEYWDSTSDINFLRYEYSSFDAPNGNPGLVSYPLTTNYFDSSWWTIPYEGTYGFQVRTVDKAGNVSGWAFNEAAGFNNSCKINIDWTAPTGSITSIYYPNPSNSMSVSSFTTNDNTPILEGTYFDANIATVTVKIDSTEQVLTYENNKWITTEPTTPLLDGSHTATLTITDKAGNTFTTTQPLIIDTIAPTATYVHYKDNNKIDETINPITYVHNIDQLSFTATYTDKEPSSELLQDSYAIFEAQDDGSFKFSQNGKKSFCNWRTEPNLVTGLVGYEYTLTEKEAFVNCIDNLPDGEYYMAHQVYDRATRKDIPTINQFRDVLGLHFIVDSKVPVIDKHDDITLVEGNSFPTSTILLTDNYGVSQVCGKGKDITNGQETSEICINTNSSNLTTDNQFKLMDVIKEQIGTWKGKPITTVDLSIIPAGQYQVTYYAYDKAGNKGNEETFTITVVDNVPTVTITAESTQITQGTSTVLGTTVTNGNSPYTYQWGGACTGTESTATFTGTNTGTYTCTVTVTDADGDTVTKSIDITATAGEVLGATTGPTTTTTKPSVKGTTTTKTTSNISEDTQTEELLETTSIEEPSVLGERCENKKKVSGYVYIDENKDKEMNDNEKGIKDITITIQYTDEEGNIKTEEEVSTDEKGYWETQLCSGKYNIVVKEDTLPKNIEVPEVLSLTVSDNEKETIFNIQALDTRNFWQKYWYLIVGGLAIIVIGYSSIKNRKKEEI